MNRRGFLQLLGLAAPAAAVASLAPATPKVVLATEDTQSGYRIMSPPHQFDDHEAHIRMHLELLKQIRQEQLR